ncbi:MAG: hypothetical protein HYW25_04460 [Candidatus Aenigmarchaeota archaeon]|nr:hypothetical protein [Candidatus Aenigmarchaeota archaeon]
MAILYAFDCVNGMTYVARKSKRLEEERERWELSDVTYGPTTEIHERAVDVREEIDHLTLYADSVVARYELD